VTLSQFLTYFGAYLQTTDPKVLGQLNNFLLLALGRVGSKFRGLVSEAVATIAPMAGGVMPLPSGIFMCVRLLTVNGKVVDWVSQSVLAELIQAGADVGGSSGQDRSYFTIVGQDFKVYPEPALSDLVTMVYLGFDPADPAAMLANISNMLLHGAAAEANLFQGDIDSAAVELKLFGADLDAANGKDIHGGTINMGGVR
jgi:hypothetical protein